MLLSITVAAMGALTSGTTFDTNVGNRFIAGLLEVIRTTASTTTGL